MPQKLGQHFLTNGAILDRIALAVCPDGEELVIEIGPGRGRAHRKTAAAGGRVIAIEIDRELVECLREKFAGETRLEIIHADVLATDLTQWGPAPIAGNLPYYITSPILEKTVRLDTPRSVFLMQKEVAERLVAGAGHAGIWLPDAADPRCSPRPNCSSTSSRAPSSPPPHVDSAVVLLTPRQAEIGRRRSRGLPQFPEPQLPTEAQDAAQ